MVDLGDFSGIHLEVLKSFPIRVRPIVELLAGPNANWNNSNQVCLETENLEYCKRSIRLQE